MPLPVEYHKMTQLRGSTADWAADDKVLLDGEIGVETDAFGKPIGLKIGGEGKAWSALDYIYYDGDFMQKSVYDPTAVEGDAFDMDNMVDGSAKVAMTVAERASLAANTTHRTSSGTDHVYIDQDLRQTANPTFAGVNGGAGAADQLFLEGTTDDGGLGLEASLLLKQSDALLQAVSGTSGTQLDMDPASAVLKRVLVATGEGAYFEASSNGAEVRWEDVDVGQSFGILVDPSGIDFQDSDAPTSLLFIGPSAIVFNETGADRDVRMEGAADAKLFFLDAGNDRIGIGTNTPSVKLDIVGQTNVTGDLGITGNVTVTGTVDGRDVSTDGTTLDTHVADLTIHRIINDAGTSTTELWSASKIDSEISTVAAGIKIKNDVVTSTYGEGDVPLSGEQTLNGVTTSTSRVLVTDQTDPAQNGIYVTSAGAWSRATDYDGTPDGEIGNGDTIHVNSAAPGSHTGTSTKNKYKYIQIEQDPITVDVSDITFVEHKDIDFGTTSGTACEGNDSRLPTQDENDALTGTGTPTAANPYVTQDTFDAWLDQDVRTTASPTFLYVNYVEQASTPAGLVAGDLWVQTQDADNKLLKYHDGTDTYSVQMSKE